MHHWLVWNVIFPLHEWAKGHPTFQILKEMEANDLLTMEEVMEVRARKLQKLLTYTYGNVPYIRRVMKNSGLDPSNIRDPVDLAKLPIMRKADVRENREQLRSRLARNLSPCSTGGSTGEPLLFDLSKERSASWIACRQRVMRWWGLSVGDREFALWGSPVEVTRQDRLRDLRDRVIATQLLSAFNLSEAVMSDYLDLLEKRGCRTIFSYPSSIYLLCLHARKEKRNLRRLGIKTVFVTGEILYPHQREVISETLNCPVANGYGGRDSGFVSYECPQGGMHIMADATIVEIVDPLGRVLPPGKQGEIVVTDLYSQEAPFLRYGTGDIGVLSTRKCPCGRPLPLLDSIQGRTTDFILAPDGRVLHALSLIYVLREIEGIEQFRIRQEQVDRFLVQIVSNVKYQAESDSRICEGFRKRLRASVDVTVVHLPNLPPEKSGKIRQVVSDISDQEAVFSDGNGQCFPNV